MTEFSTTEPEDDSVANSPSRDSIVTIPNAICAFRLLGAISLFGFALTNNPRLFAGLYTILSLSDWIDGKLARWLNQRSVFGARFDSIADTVMFSSLLFGIAWLRTDVLRDEAAWWVTGLLSFVLSSAAGLWKFGKMPAYHTYGAKLSNWLVLIGAVCLLLDFSIWPFRIAMLAGTLTNLETTAMTWCLKEWRSDILTILHVIPQRNKNEK